jgi:FdrA protein
MGVNILVKRNSYFDSVTFMKISKEITSIEGVRNASVSMGTDLNKELLKDAGLANDETENTTANDLIIAFEVEDDSIADEVFSAIKKSMSKKAQEGPAESIKPLSINTALHQMPDANIAVISVPGEFAALEAKKALLNGLNVILFSDNVSIEDEKMLKELAHEKGLLMMGPDCGTAIINQKGICFANAVREGKIGIVGASGTGTQEISVLVHKYGEGISQVIGTGGRDLSESIGGITMLDALKALNQDEKTEVIVLISKQPVKSVADKIIAESRICTKPVVICFINSKKDESVQGNIYFESNLEAAAKRAVNILRKTDVITEEEIDVSLIKEVSAGLKKSQKYVRGLFCGGTLCEEAFNTFKNEYKVGKVYSNISKNKEEKLQDPLKSIEHSFIDLGDDQFTVGKPHPMIDPSNRITRILEEANDDEVAVILLDFELGYGSHIDPVGITIPSIIEAQKLSREKDRNLAFVAYVCGTDLDRQNLEEQERKLSDLGVILAKSNVHAAKITSEIMKGVSYEQY